MIATLAASRALTDLVDTGRDIERIAWTSQLHDLAVEIAKVVDTLDAVRTKLVEDGPSYLDEAWSFVDAARVVIASYGIELAKAVGARARS